MVEDIELLAADVMLLICITLVGDGMGHHDEVLTEHPKQQSYMLKIGVFSISTISHGSDLRKTFAGRDRAPFAVLHTIGSTLRVTIVVEEPLDDAEARKGGTEPVLTTAHEDGVL